MAIARGDSLAIPSKFGSGSPRVPLAVHRFWVFFLQENDLRPTHRKGRGKSDTLKWADTIVAKVPGDNRTAKGNRGSLIASPAVAKQSI